jgi:hypothetical protein
MKYDVEMYSDAVIYILSLIMTGSSNPKLIGADTQTAW